MNTVPSRGFYFEEWRPSKNRRDSGDVNNDLTVNVIHTVGPIARGNVGQVQREDLTSCYKSSLKLMEEYSLRSVVSAVRSQTFIRLRLRL
ncbi:ADP-ribose glycohydrolase MACROD2 isoform X1 [Tachysurus ichikawai]